MQLAKQKTLNQIEKRRPEELVVTYVATDTQNQKETRKARETKKENDTYRYVLKEEARIFSKCDFQFTVQHIYLLEVKCVSTLIYHIW